MSFSFNTTAGASQSTVKPKLAGNEIYSVKFDGVEIKDIENVDLRRIEYGLPPLYYDYLIYGSTLPSNYIVNEKKFYEVY